MVSHEVWFEGGATPVLVDLEDDQLFQQFKRWIQQDNQFTARGWIGTVEGKTWALNFNQVACITLLPARDRRTMGFSA
jgi:hypothetical protein